MTYRYGWIWNSRLGRPAEEMAEAQARERYRKGPQLSVSRVADGQTVPDFTLILGPDGSHVRIMLYDANGSTTEVFDYSAVAGDERLFLDNYKVYVYADQARSAQTFSKSAAHKAWVFRPDGTATCREVVKPLPDARVSHYRDLDVTSHWRPRPGFGEWDSFGEHPEPGRPMP